MTAAGHIPVLLRQTVAALAPHPGQVFVDCTAGLGGHAAAVAIAMQVAGVAELAPVVVLNDADPANLACARTHVEEQAPGAVLHVLQGNFAEVPNRLPALGLRADMVLADLGFASTQIDDPARGFAFSHDGPLDMRMDPSLAISAADLVNSLSEAELARVIDQFGEDRNARRIARKLVQSRAENPILTTARLAELVRAASPGGGRGSGIHPATRTFQALRMMVNDELGSLEALLGAMVREAEQLAAGRPTRWLAPGARLAVISFHSLEDRPVKRAMEQMVAAGAQDLTSGAAVASEDEKQANPRARSAKLRAVRLPG